MKNRNLIYIILFMAAILHTAVLAQTSISVLQEASYYSNSFYNYKQLPDYNNYSGLQFGHFWTGENVHSKIFYQGNLNFFKTYSERFYQHHKVGYSGSSSSQTGNKNYYFGTNVVWHKNQDYYSLYNYWKLAGYANAKIKFDKNLIARFGYMLKNKNYSELPEFSYWEHYLFLKLNTYFQTGTSFTFSMNYGLKDYIPLQVSSGRWGAEYFEMPGVDQLVTSLKMAQSLTAKSAVNIKYLNRINPGLPGGAVSVINSEELFTEDELFDDRFGYTGHEVSLTFTQYLPGYIKMELGGAQLWKNYQNRQVFDLAGNIILTNNLRADTRAITWASLSRSFGRKFGLKNIAVYLEGGYLKNSSNDPYYTFDNYFTSFGLKLNVT